MRWLSEKLTVTQSYLIELPADYIRVFAENAPSLERVLELRQSARIDSDRGRRRSVNLPFRINLAVLRSRSGSRILPILPSRGNTSAQKHLST